MENQNQGIALPVTITFSQEQLLELGKALEEAKQASLNPYKDLRGKALFIQIIRGILADRKSWNQWVWGRKNLQEGDALVVTNKETGEVLNLTAHNDSNYKGIDADELGVNLSEDDYYYGTAADRLMAKFDFAPASCGTAFCIAGHAVSLVGAKLNWIPKVDGQRVFGFETNTCTTLDGEDATVSGYAAKLLEIRSYSTLFEGGNDLEAILTIARNLYDDESLLEPATYGPNYTRADLGLDHVEEDDYEDEDEDEDDENED